MISGPRYLDERYRGNPPRFLGAQQQQPPESSEDKGSADVNEEIEVQGLAIPAHGKLPGAAASRRELRRRSGPVTTLQGRAGSRLRSGFDVDGDGYRDRCGGGVRHPGPADPVSRRPGAGLRCGTRPCLQTGPTITARAIRGASNSQQLRCTTYRRRWPRHIAVLLNAALSQLLARPIP